MIKSIFVFAKKEILRFFSDKKLIITNLILPGVLIYMLYSLFCYSAIKSEEYDEKYVPSMFVVNCPDMLYDSIRHSFHISHIEGNDFQQSKHKIEATDVDLLVVFPTLFEENIRDNIVSNVEVYFNSTSRTSQKAYINFCNYLNAFESRIVNVLDINNNVNSPDLANEKDIASNVLSLILPMIITLMLFNSCLSISAESFAGEKERGTFPTILVTPTKRRDVVLGKVLGSCVIAFLSGMSSFLGVILVVPKILEAEKVSNEAVVFEANDYLCLFFLMIFSILVIVSLISIMSICSDSIKTATAMTAPVTIIATLLGMLPMIVTEEFESFFWYIIPVFNSVICLNKIFTFDLSIVNFVITIVINFVAFAFNVFCNVKLINNEKNIF